MAASDGAGAGLGQKAGAVVLLGLVALAANRFTDEARVAAPPGASAQPEGASEDRPRTSRLTVDTQAQVVVVERARPARPGVVITGRACRIAQALDQPCRGGR